MPSRILLIVFALVLVLVEFSPPARAAGIVIQRAEWSGRKFSICVSDADRAPGERIQIDFYVNNAFYDRLDVANGFPTSCADREFAPFGPRAGGHRIAPLLADEPGGGTVVLPTKVLTEDCDAFGETNAAVWCRSTMHGTVAQYYGIRQEITIPLVSPSVWAGVTLGYGGLIQQLYSSDRTYNLIDEHVAGGMGLAMWGVAQPAFPQLSRCNWDAPPPHGTGPPMEVMHVIFPQGPNCNYGIWPEATALGIDRSAVTSLMSILYNPEHHGRRLTLANFNMGQIVTNRGEYLELLYGYRNLSAWDFGAIDQEIPALHLNRGVNREFAWSRDEAPGYGYRAVAEGEVWATRLVVPGISPFSGPGTETWNGRWITVCSAGRVHCVTIAPAAPPSASGINMANLRANTDLISTRFGETKSNQISLVGRFAIPRSAAIHAHTAYLFPYLVIQPLPSGLNVLQRIQQLQQW